MILYPMLELLDGRYVSLFRGRTDEPHIWHVDPVAKAKSFAKAGAEWLHITDFDAMSGDERNTDLIREIIQTVGVSVQIGGDFGVWTVLLNGLITARDALLWEVWPCINLNR